MNVKIDMPNGETITQLYDLVSTTRIARNCQATNCLSWTTNLGRLTVYFKAPVSISNIIDSSFYLYIKDVDNFDSMKECPGTIGFLPGPMLEFTDISFDMNWKLAHCTISRNRSAAEFYFDIEKAGRHVKIRICRDYFDPKEFEELQNTVRVGMSVYYNYDAKELIVGYSFFNLNVGLIEG